MPQKLISQKDNLKNRKMKDGSTITRVQDEADGGGVLTVIYLKMLILSHQHRGR